MYMDGEGDLEDDPDRLKWLRAAADGGYPPAQYDLGCRYADGYEVELDGAEAERWMLLAADQGLAQAMYALNRLYAEGELARQRRSESP